MSPLLEVIPRTTDLHVSAKTDVNNKYINHLELSIHLILGLPFGLLPSITPAYTFLVVLSLFMSSNLHFHFSCLLLITFKMSSCPSHCLTSSLLILSIWSICSLLNSSQHTHLGSLHSLLLLLCQVPHLTPYHNEGTIIALTTLSFAFLLSYFPLSTISLILPTILVALAILAYTSFSILLSLAT